MINKVAIFNNMQIWHETFGDKNNPAVLLMMGNGCDAMLWPGIFCENLARRGFYVIRFDQRDTGLSSWIDFTQNPYTLMDMAGDAVGLLDVLDIQKSHIVGFSTGGLIAQLLALHFPQRILSLTLMMTSIDLTIKNDAFCGIDMSGAKLPPPKPEFIQAVLQLNSVKPVSLPEKIKRLVDNFRLANGAKAPYDEQFFYQLFECSLKRIDGKLNKVGHESNHSLATSATPMLREEELASISKPTLVIEGGEDPIFPGHAEAMVKLIPNAQLLLIEEMGHTLNPHYFSVIINAMADHMVN